jgi:hypothetical protein
MAKVGTQYAITPEDSATREIARIGHVSAQAGKLQAWFIPAEQRTHRMRKHLRVTIYTMESGCWKRRSKDAFVAKMDAEA